MDLNFTVYRSASRARRKARHLNKRHGYYFDEGCGCCSFSTDYRFDEDTQRLLRVSYRRYMDAITVSVEVIGKVTSPNRKKLSK